MSYSAQTTPENLHRDFGAYTLDPGTRYPNLNRGKVSPHQVTTFYDSDDPLPLDAAPAARKRRRGTFVFRMCLLIGDLQELYSAVVTRHTAVPF